MTTLRATLTQVRDQMTQRPLAQDLAPAELDALLAQMGEPRYRARQVFHWLHGRMATRWEQMSDLPAGLRVRLAERLDANAGQVVADQRSTDGTRKLLIRLRDGERIETVGIPARDGRLLALHTGEGSWAAAEPVAAQDHEQAIVRAVAAMLNGAETASVLGNPARAE